MLMSITPLGERGRGQRWGVTTTLFIAGATLGGAVLGGVLGLLGQQLHEPLHVGAGVRVVALAILLLASFALDLSVDRIPGPRRQVNENWLPAYRGWVYGGGFGVQLGLGLVTIVTTSLVWVTFIAALLSASPEEGLWIGGVFGAVRGATIFAAASVAAPADLSRLGVKLERWRPVSAQVARSTQIVLAASLVLIAI